MISLNQLHSLHRDVPVDRPVIDMLLAAEIVGHYRSYQVLGPLRAHLQDDHNVLDSLRQSMERELERIFRLMGLLYPSTELHDAYVGVRSSNRTVRANALEFLDNVLPPELRQVLVPLLDSQVTLDERIELADRLVGAPLDGAEQAAATLLASDDPWLRSAASSPSAPSRFTGSRGGAAVRRRVGPCISGPSTSFTRLMAERDQTSPSFGDTIRVGARIVPGSRFHVPVRFPVLGSRFPVLGSRSPGPETNRAGCGCDRELRTASCGYELRTAS